MKIKINFQNSEAAISGTEFSMMDIPITIWKKDAQQRSAGPWLPSFLTRQKIAEQERIIRL